MLRTFTILTMSTKPKASKGSIIYTTPTKLSIPNMPTRSFISNQYSKFITSTVGKKSNSAMSTMSTHPKSIEKVCEDASCCSLLTPPPSPSPPLECPCQWP